MKIVNCLIADDEKMAVSIIQSHVSKIEYFNVAGICSTGMQVYNFLKTSEVDLLFLDIQMPVLNGLELLKTVKNPPAVILTTAHREYALDAFDFNVIDYLLKPISFERFLKAIDKYHNINRPQTAPYAADSIGIQKGNQHFIYVKSEKKMVKVLIKDIRYIEGLKGFLKIHTGTAEIVTYQTLNEFEANLPADIFIRIHRSFIISTNYLSAYSASHIEIDKKQLPIGGSYAEALMQKLKIQ